MNSSSVRVSTICRKSGPTTRYCCSNCCIDWKDICCCSNRTGSHRAGVLRSRREARACRQKSHQDPVLFRCDPEQSRKRELRALDRGAVRPCLYKAPSYLCATPHGLSKLLSDHRESHDAFRCGIGRNTLCQRSRYSRRQREKSSLHLPIQVSCPFSCITSWST